MHQFRGLLEHFSPFIVIGGILSSTPSIARDAYSLKLRRIVELHIEELLCDRIFEVDFITIR